MRLRDIFTTLAVQGLLATALVAGQLNLAVKQVVINDHC